MLSNVLGAYLDRVRERELDLPFLLLLPALGFRDVHLTHGAVEFGTDFIGKKRENGQVVQYAFQSKAGEIDVRTWRNDVRGQLESAQAGLVHPNFDDALERQVVLVTTGELTNAASIEMQRWNDDHLARYGIRPVPVWSKQNLLEFYLTHGLEGVHRATAAGFGEFGRFFLTYSRALQGIITVREIEQYSRQWSNADIDPERRLLQAAIESEVLAQQCIERDLVYEAIQFQLARLRLLCELTYSDGAGALRELWEGAVAQLHALCTEYITQIRTAWAGEMDLLKTWFDDLHMNTYPVQCARIIEIASLAYFTAADVENRDQYVAFVAEFVQAEPGCGHPISDRYAVSLVLATLLLLDGNRADIANRLLEQTTVWLCDHYDDAAGLAGIEADEELETSMLLGQAFEFIDVHPQRSSLLATGLLDLAAFSGDPALYADIVNDVKAVRIAPEYWQPRDTIGAVRIEGDDVLHYPNVGFADALPIDGSPYAEHIPGEQASFRFVDAYGATAAVAICALLRDRYFPKLFPILAPNHAESILV
jgi:hypothetical protein